MPRIQIRMAIAIAGGLIFSAPFWLIPPIWQAGFFTPVALVAYGLVVSALVISEACWRMADAVTKRRA